MLSVNERNEAFIIAEIAKTGSLCPVPPKIKIKALFIIFGFVILVIILYNVLRNIFKERIE